MKLPPFRASAVSLALLLAAYFAVILNYGFYAKVLALNPFQGSQDLFLFSVPFFVFFVLSAAFSLLILPYVHKVLIPLLLLASAAVSYQIIFYGIYFDSEMLNNVLQTHYAESARLITLPYVLWIAVFGLLPAILYLLTRVEYRGIKRELLSRLGVIAVSALALWAIGYGFYQDYASFARNNKAIVHTIVPSNIIGAGIKKLRQYQNAHRSFEQVGLDAAQAKPDNYRHVTIIVLGETTRAQNWSLNGYERQTTPRLAARKDVVNFKYVESCGTATGYSLPCMFSNLPAKEFNNSNAPYRDGLLDILQRAGVKVTWFENDGGCKEVCNRVEYKNMTELNLDKYCRNGECLDEILFEDLDKALAASQEDTLIVLHTIGSHGPTYYERYPKAFEKFSPTCDTNLINQCSNQQLVNTYDNGILYIDYIIDKAIRRLEREKYWESTLLYVSDHGESLGENGLYLHSAPYMVAPEYQTRVPMVMWFSELWNKNEGVDLACLKRLGEQGQFSHDNFFHTVIGMLDMNLKLSVYQPGLDILAQCKKP